LRRSTAGGDLLLFGEGDLDGGDLFLGFDGPGEYEPVGGGVGSRTADDSRAVPDIIGFDAVVPMPSNPVNQRHIVEPVTLLQKMAGRII